MTIDKQALAKQYAHRKARNLVYFQKHHPAIFKRFQSFMMRRVEVAISPVEQDIDVLIGGTSQYHGRAAAVCREETNYFLKHHEQAGSIRSINPPWPGAFGSGGFAESRLNEFVGKSPLVPGEFAGYRLSDGFFPQIVFLGCAAGFHIQYLLEKVNVVNAVVFEPDPELFAASLFCVDWESVGSKFNANRGESLVFLIGGDNPMSDEQQMGMLQSYLYPSAPLYPYMTIFFNHLNNPNMVRVAKKLSQDIHKFRISWLDYDDTLRRANNCFHNLATSPSVLLSKPLDEPGKNVLIVGSGPSIDERFGELVAHRDKCVVVSAGTGIKGLLENGIVPDFHVELDPDYLVYGYLKSVPREVLASTVLIAVNEVNPLVAELFDQKVLYFKKENPTTLFFESNGQSFAFCNPTCTNAALSLFVNLGFQNLFLFGCDLGYKNFNRHHSTQSIYESDETEVSERLKRRAELRSSEKSSFKVAGVNGTEVYTRADFFVARQEMEQLMASASAAGSSSTFFNCSDGADIGGTRWLSPEEFQTRMADESVIARDVIRKAVCNHSFEYSGERLRELAQKLEGAVAEHADGVRTVFRETRLQGRPDLTRAVHRVARRNGIVVRRLKGQPALSEQYYGQYIIAGAIKSFLMVGITHGMALKDEEVLKSFLSDWAEALETFLNELPVHFKAVIDSGLSPREDPWVLNTMKWVRAASTAAGPIEEVAG